MVEPRDDQPVTLAYTLCVMLMRYLQAMSAFTQLWGGAMAMTRAAYVKYGVAQLWLENVVDDCSLTALLQVRGAKVRLCPGALLHTDAVNHSTPVWRAWMDRQVLFLKFCMPGQWKLLGLMCVMMALPIVCAALAFLAGGDGERAASVAWSACQARAAVALVHGLCGRRAHVHLCLLAEHKVVGYCLARHKV